MRLKTRLNRLEQQAGGHEETQYARVMIYRQDGTEYSLDGKPKPPPDSERTLVYLPEKEEDIDNG